MKTVLIWTYSIPPWSHGTNTLKLSIIKFPKWLFVFTLLTCPISMENVHASKHIKSLTGTPEKLNKSLVDQCRWHKDMMIPAHFLTWRAASSILLQSEFWKTRTLVGPHGVDAQMLTEFPTIEQTFIQVVSRKVIWQFGFITDGQSFVVIFCLWNYKRTTLAGSLTGVLALGLYSMELLLPQTPDTAKVTQNSYTKDKRNPSWR